MDKCKVESYNKCHICKKIKKLNVWFSINRSIDYMDKIDDSLYNKHTDYNIYFCSVNCMKIYRYNINKETKKERKIIRAGDGNGQAAAFLSRRRR